eukprot:COSAG05_NODE_3466_length_2042_cov_1.710757_1_plen_93_part_00
MSQTELGSNKYSSQTGLLPQCPLPLLDRLLKCILRDQCLSRQRRPRVRVGGTNIDPTEWIGSVYLTLSRCRALADLVAVRVEAAADAVVVSS